MSIKVIRIAYYGPDCDWSDKDELVVTSDMVQTWKPKVAEPVVWDGTDSRTFIEQSEDELEHWKELGFSMLESLDEGDEEDVDSVEEMSAHVEYHTLTKEDSQVIRSWLA